MALTVLNVAYPLAPIGPDAVGGAEQILTQIDSALVQAGHRSLVIACEGSVARGTLLAVPRAVGELDGAARTRAWANYRQAIAAALDRWPVDVVHLHGVDCSNYLPPPGVPVLITLHLPPHWYCEELFSLRRPRTFLHCVSCSQQRVCPASGSLLPVIENGVDVNALRPVLASRGGFALCLGRICPEKGFHLALDAAHRADFPLILAGDVFGYPAHQEYFRQQILPRLDHFRRFIGPAGLERKRRLLSAATCLLVPSLAPETSSLVAMEALACGTPVIALAAGALPEIIEDGRTGFIVKDEIQMAGAIAECGSMSARTCRAAAESRFSLAVMLQKYFEVYTRLADSLQEGEFSTTGKHARARSVFSQHFR